MKYFEVFSSHGHFHVDSSTGIVIELIAYKNGDDLSFIHKFDTNEWLKAYPDEQLEDFSIDILDIGYWTVDGIYEPADPTYRQNFQKERQQVRDGRMKVIV